VVGIVALVGDQITGIRQAFREHHGTGDVGSLTRRQIECQGVAMRVSDGVDLGVAASLGAADGLNRSPPFPPPAQRRALTWVVSMEISSGVPASTAVSLANMYC